jgi:hypothetical protein
MKEEIVAWLKILSHNLYERTEENHEEFVKIAGALLASRTERLPNKIRKRYRASELAHFQYI